MNKTHLSQIFKLLADVNRLRILSILQERRLCVCELAFILEVTQPSISRHLKKLKIAGIVDSEKAGFWTDYFLKISDHRVRTLLQCLSEWLKDDPRWKKDRHKLSRAKRHQLCNTKNKIT